MNLSEEDFKSLVNILNDKIVNPNVHFNIYINNNSVEINSVETIVGFNVNLKFGIYEKVFNVIRVYLNPVRLVNLTDETNLEYETDEDNRIFEEKTFYSILKWIEGFCREKNIPDIILQDCNPISQHVVDNAHKDYIVINSHDNYKSYRKEL